MKTSVGVVPEPKHDRVGSSRGRADLLSFGLLAATGFLMAAISWFRWPDVLIDYGRELYVPWRITAGEMLYKDIPHLYGPLAHYVNALLFSLFGTSLRTLVSFNLLLIGVLTYGIYLIFRRAYDRLTATLCGMVFLGVFAFGHDMLLGNWNFVCPYSHEITYGICLFFLMVPALERFLERKDGLWAAGVGLVLGLIFLTKIEVFLAAFFAASVVVILPAARARSLKIAALGKLPHLIAGFALPLLFFVVLFASRTTIAAAFGMVTTTVTSLGRAPIVRNSLYQWISGLDAPVENVALMVAVGAVYGTLAIGIHLLSRFFARHGGAGRHPLALAAIVLAFAVAAAFLRGRLDWWSLAARPFPLFVLAYVVLLLRRAWKEGLADGRMVPALAVAVFGLFLLFKILLQARLGMYGFALTMPATLIVAATAIHHLPAHIASRGGCAATAKVAATTLVVLFLLLQANISKDVYDQMTYRVGDGKDQFRTLDPSAWDRGPVVNATLKAIETNMPANAGFVVIPEGVMLNYLARRPNPGKWFEFTPNFVAAIGEERMCADLESARPPYVILTGRTTLEFGATSFGADYGFKIKEWITGNYTPVYKAGAKLFSGEGFGIVIAKRNEESRPGPDPVRRAPWGNR